MQTRKYPYYSDFLKQIKEIQKFFDVSYFPVQGEKFSLLKLEFLKYKNRPLLVLMAGCHGEEPAPIIALFKNYKIFQEKANTLKVNLIIYPLVNPWGFDRNKRLNRKNLNCNSSWIHGENSKRAEEVKTILKDIKNLKPKIFTNLHEDDETDREFYLFSFGKREYEKHLIKIGAKYFPILKDCYLKNDDAFVKNGVIYNKHDESAEDLMSHQKVKFSCCIETPSHQPLQQRIKCYTDIILKLLELTSKP